MLSPKVVLVAEVAAAIFTLGAAFAIPAAALPGDDGGCPENSAKTCQTPPESCPAGTIPAPVQPPAGGGVTCNLDSLVRARAKSEVLTHDQVLKLCADARVRGLAAVRVAVGYPKYEVITLDGKTCGEPITSFKNCAEAEAAGYQNIPSTDPRYDPRLDRDHDGIACETPTVPVTSPAPSTDIPAAPAPTIVKSTLPVTH